VLVLLQLWNSRASGRPKQTVFALLTARFSAILEGEAPYQ
jgi:hypothetical protein